MPTDNLDTLAPLTKAQVCTLLGIHLATLNRLISNGELRVIYVGPGRRSPRITRAALEDYLERAALEPDELMGPR